MKSYISYIDTDSLFIKLGQFIEDMGVPIDKWNALDAPIKIKYLLKLSEAIENDVNERSYNETQLIDYNCLTNKDYFAIIFKQEIICSNILHVASKMYCYHVINDEGFDCDRIDAKGIEIVRSNSPKAFRESLKSFIRKVLKSSGDEELIDYIEESKASFYSARPEDVSTNIGVNNITKYVSEDNTYGKGTPYHIKGVANYRFLLKEMGIENKYQPITEGDKCRVVYVKKNRHGVKVVTYYKWPTEFKKNGILVDYDTMIEKYFTGKAEILLTPMNKVDILNGKDMLDEFF